MIPPVLDPSLAAERDVRTHLARASATDTLAATAGDELAPVSSTLPGHDLDPSRGSLVPVALLSLVLGALAVFTAALFAGCDEGGLLIVEQSDAAADADAEGP